jgi:ATP-binding cassette subfamily B multidrug efflux pump
MDDEILGKAYDARLMRRLLRYLRPYWRAVLVALAAIIAGSALQLVPPWLTKQIIDVAIPARDFDALSSIAGLFLGVLLAEFALQFVQTWTLNMTGQRIMFDIRMQLYEHLQRLDVRFYDRNPVGRLMTRVTTDVDALNELFTSGVVTVFGDVFTLLGIMVTLLIMDWQLALIAFSVLPFIVLITQWFRVHVRQTYRDVRTWIARINAFLQENITGVSTVQLFRREQRNFDQFRGINEEHRQANLRAIFYYSVFYPAIELVSALATALLLWFGGARVLSDTLTLGTLVAFIQYAQRFFRPIADLSEKFNIMQAAMASSERIFGLLDTPVEIGSGGSGGSGRSGGAGGRMGAAERADAAGHQLASEPATQTYPTNQTDQTNLAIAFDHVWFAYNDDDFVLRDVSFTIAPGERIGVVGATGAGKTTLINLLLRFYDVSRGRITVDGGDIRKLPLDRLRGLFGLVLQDVHLFSGTIASNVRLGRADISDADVHRVLEAVHATRFVNALGGIDAPVVERGATLSVGQKQLLSFARALAFDPRVLILDEATSSIDTETEILIRDALRVLMQGRTTLAIAHRLSTIQDMDRILVFHKGQLREAGTHQELLAEKGIYRKLFELQYSE